MTQCDVEYTICCITVPFHPIPHPPTHPPFIFPSIPWVGTGSDNRPAPLQAPCSGSALYMECSDRNGIREQWHEVALITHMEPHLGLVLQAVCKVWYLLRHSYVIPWVCLYGPRYSVWSQ